MTPYVPVLTAFLLSMLLVYILIPAIVRLSIAKKLFDVPNERRVNKTVVPNLGGIALFAAISISCLLSIYDTTFPDIRYIMVAMIVMFYTGLKDDILMITPKKKLMAQLISAFVLVVLGDIRLTDMHGIFGLHQLGDLSSELFSMLVVVAVMNAINLIDGIDGLAAGLGIFISLFFGSAFFMDGQYPYAILSFSITGSLVAFDLFNVFGRKNKIFMGDTGSLLLGTLFAVLAIKYNEFAIGAANESYAPALSLAVLSVPLFDMARVFCVRLHHKRSPFSADMSHIHHKLLRLGFSHAKSTTTIVLVNLLVTFIVYVFRDQEIHLLIGLIFLLEFLFSLLADYALDHQKSA